MKFRSFHALLVSAFIVSNVHAAVRTVILSGQAAPGVNGGTFAQLHYSGADPLPPVIDDAGHAAFAGTLNLGPGGVTAPDDTGIWSEGSGALSLVGREGSAAPGGPAGGVFRRLTNPVLNPSGKIAFSGLLRVNVAGVTLTTNEGLWSSGGGALTMLAREGNQAPGAPAGVLFGTPFDATLSSSGQVAFRATLTGAGVTAANDRAMFAQKAGAVNMIARVGAPAPGAPAGVNFGNFPAALPVINGASQVAFRGILAGTGVTTANDGAIFVERAGALALVAREGTAAPGAGAGINFANLADPVLNSAGQTAFVSTLVGGAVATNVGFFAETGNTLSLVARKGSAAPGTPAGVNFANFTNPMLNGAGNTAFLATLSGAAVTTANDGGLWAQRDSALDLVAREGAQAPGVAAGINFASLADATLNPAGQLAFSATLAGAGITTANDAGLWAQSIGGELKLIAREGDPLQVAPGVTRTISSLLFAGGVGNEDGRRNGFNSRGELAFLANFTDGTSGVFVSDLVKAIAGDFDGDADADGADFAIWQRNLGRTGGGLADSGDANGDGNVDAADLAIWKNNFVGPAAAGAALSVPEPAAVATFAVAAVALGLAHRRRSANAA
jgi:hypothetical protein